MNLKLLVEGGAMKPGPAVSQKLGPAGVNINEIISKVNEATVNFAGMQVPVEIIVDMGTKKFEVNVFSPPISGLIKKEAGIKKASGRQAQIKVANLSIEQIIKIANTKLPNLLCKDLQAAVKITLGSCVSLGILIENKSPKEVMKDVEAGKYNKEISSVLIETPEEKKKELEVYFKNLKEKQDLILKKEAETEASVETKEE